MSELILKHWPFESDEEVMLYWHGYPFLNEREHWMIKCLFQKPDKSFEEIAFPFATLPNLKIGQYYKDGKFTERLPIGELSEVKISSDKISFDICQSFDYPKTMYSFDKYPAVVYGRLPVCRFSVQETNYYIPCTEVIRSILAPNKMLANELLKPNGLDQFIAGSYQSPDRLEISLTKEYDRRFIDIDAVSYFVWLRFNKAAYESYTQICFLRHRK